MEGRGDVDGIEDGEMAVWGSGLRVERSKGDKQHEDLSMDICHHPTMIKCPKLGAGTMCTFWGRGCVTGCLLRQGLALYLQSSYVRLPSTDTGTVQPCV